MATTDPYPTSGFYLDSYQKVMQSLDTETLQAIEDKARWEHMSKAAVMECWWPEEWAKVEKVKD